MTALVTWREIAVRLLLAALVGAVIGLDRGERGRPAGFRTTLLVCLAAALAMVQTNLLLATAGKTTASFAVADVMRLPLGILTGMGFIGAGAILKRDGAVRGVTSAATLWFVTVIGLCLGGGQIALGLTGAVAGFLVVWGLRWFDERLKHQRVGTLTVSTTGGEPSCDSIVAMVRSWGCAVDLRSVTYSAHEEKGELEFGLSWRGDEMSRTMPSHISSLSKTAGVLLARWHVL